MKLEAYQIKVVHRYYKINLATYFNGLANNRCPIVTKLVSWFDMNHAREDTLKS